MKKTIISISLLLLAILSLSACKEKKVESKSHFGYTLDYAKEKFDVKSFYFSNEYEHEFVYTNDQEHLIRFSNFYVNEENLGYVDFIVIASNNHDDLLPYLEQINKFMYLYTEHEFEQISALCNQKPTGNAENINGTFYNYHDNSDAEQEGNIYSLWIGRDHPNNG